MLRGPRVLLRPMRREDIPRQHAFEQDLEIYGLDCSRPQVASIEHTQRFYEKYTGTDDTVAPFAIEADGVYIGHCTLRHLQHPHRNFELGIGIGDRAYWGRGYGREAIGLLLEYAFHYLGAPRRPDHPRTQRASDSLLPGLRFCRRRPPAQSRLDRRRIY